MTTELVPADRAPGNNTAHLVVGLMTSYTHVPEGLGPDRPAVRPDPGAGATSPKPECRRINAVLAYALEHSIPVEVVCRILRRPHRDGLRAPGTWTGSR